MVKKIPTKQLKAFYLDLKKELAVHVKTLVPGFRMYIICKNELKRRKVKV